MCPPCAARQDASERRGPRLWHRARCRVVGQCGSFGIGPATHLGFRAQSATQVAAPDYGRARGRSGRSGVEEGALLPGHAVLASLAGHARHLRRHCGDEPTAVRDAAQVVAEDAILSAAARPVHGKGGRRTGGNQW